MLKSKLFGSRSLLIGSVFGVLLSSCSDGGGSANPTGDLPAGVKLASSSLARSASPSTSNVPALGASNADFAFALYRGIAAANADKNVVFSPHSISTALAMTYEGARTATESEIKTALHFDLDKPALHEAFNATDLALASRGEGKAGADGTRFRLNVNNSLWAQRDYPVVPTFLDVLATNYGGGVFLVDFAGNPESSRKAINSWVAEKTEDLIPELLEPSVIDSQTRLVLTNTVYLNAGWQQKFKKESTVDAPFTKLDGSTVSSKMMSGVFEGVAVAVGSNYTAVVLPYEDEKLRFVAVLPNPGALADVEASMNSAWLGELNGKLNSGGASISLPQLDFGQTTELIPQLKALGMTSAFGPGADFSGLTPESAYITDVVHQAELKVLEGGTVAAAATAVVFGRKSDIPMLQTIRFDRPFLFAITDEPTGALLFVGRVLDPTAK